MRNMKKALLVIMFGAACFASVADEAKVDKQAGKAMLNRQYLAEELDITNVVDKTDVTNAVDEAEVEKEAKKVMFDRKYLANELDGATVEEMGDYIIKGIKNVDASDLSDEEKMEAITLGMADILVMAGDNVEELMKMVVSGIDDAGRMQLAVAIAALATRSDKSVVLDSLIKQLGGADTELGKLAQEAADAPVVIVGQRLRVLVSRIVFPAKSLSSARLAGGARTLPLPPIRRPEDYGKKHHSRPKAHKKPRKHAKKYSGQ